MISQRKISKLGRLRKLSYSIIRCAKEHHYVKAVSHFHVGESLAPAAPNCGSDHIAL